MTTDHAPLDDSARDALAGELALGVLEGEERVAALRLMLADRDFAARVDRWRSDTSGLFDAVDSVPPPPGVWPQIASAIEKDAIERDAAGSIRPARTIAPAAKPGAWRGIALASMAAAAALAGVLVFQGGGAPSPVAPRQVAVAQLTGSIAGLRIAAHYDPATAQLRVRATGMPYTPTAPELWIVPADGIPRSLGQIARDGETLVVVGTRQRGWLTTGGALALSMEPPATAPHRTPSAPMVATGPIDLI